MPKHAARPRAPGRPSRRYASRGGRADHHSGDRRAGRGGRGRGGAALDDRELGAAAPPARRPADGARRRRRRPGGSRRRRCRRPSCSCATGSRRPPQRLDERMIAAERRIDGSRRPHRRWCATTPTARCPGRQSSSRRAARLPPQRRGRVRDPPPRPGARVREADARGRVRGRALAGGASRPWRRAHGRRAHAAPDARRLPRPGRDLQRGGAPRLRARPVSRRCPCPPSTRR